MATRLEYRTNLNNKLLALEDGSYGDFEYTTAELDTYLDLAIAALYPAIYKKNSVEALDVVGYGSAQLGYVTDTTIQFDSVYMVEDGDKLTTITAWEVRSDRVLGIDNTLYSSVNVHWIEPYTLDESDLGENTIPAVLTPLITLGALIEALEARQDTGVRGEPQPTGVFMETQLIDRLKPRYDKMLESFAMALPGMRF